VRSYPIGPAPGQSRSAADVVGDLAESFLERYRRGERPSVEEYAKDHPELAGEIRRLFPALLMMEDIRPESDDLSGNLAAGGTTLERLGDYRILREIGRGGMGVVYEAEQESLGRRVALKVLAAYGLRHPKQLLRFHREARAAARLHHTNIVPVFGVGESEGQHYYVMQFISGLGLDAVLEEIKQLRGHGPEELAPAPPEAACALSTASVARSLMSGRLASAPAQDSPNLTAIPDTATHPPFPAAPSSVVLPGQSRGSSSSDAGSQYARSVAMIGVQVAEALDYAHRQGTLHRDIKPSNLLLDGQGTVWVADFGLAKAADSDDLTHTGDIVGTVRYMAPERFEGRCDARSDVYALGLTLYELLARRPAFDKSERAELIRQVTHEEPARLRALDTTIPRDLETVVHKAIEREPARRYGDAGALAADLRRFVEGRAIRARRVSPVEHAWRWCRGNPAVAALGAAVLVLGGLSVAGALWVQRQRADAVQREALQQAERRAEAAVRAGRAQDAVTALVDQAATLRQQGLWTEARALLAQAEGQLNDAGGRDLPERLRQAQADVELAARLEGNAIARMDFARGMSNYSAVAAEYAAAFQGAGLAVTDDAADAEAIAARIRRSAIHDQLVAGLDDWAVVNADARLRARLLGIARLSDPDPGWRDRVRDPSVWADRQALERLAAEVREASGAEQPPQVLMTLARLLDGVRGSPAPLLRAVQARRPDDFWLNHALGALLLHDRPAEAVGFLRAALVQRPRDVLVTYRVGFALDLAGQPLEALAMHRRAIALDPNSPLGHQGLGVALHSLARLEQAAAAFRRAIALDPNLPQVHHSLGNALRNLGRPEEAVTAYRRAIALDPNGAPAFHGLGNALSDLGSSAEAVEAYRKAVALDPRLPMPHFGLGQELFSTGHRDEAISELRQAIILDGQNVGLAPFFLGAFLRMAGRYDEAASTLRRLRERVKDDADQIRKVDAELIRVERDAALAARLHAVLRGDDRPANSAERLEFARLALDRRLHAAAARLYAAALAADPKLAEDRESGHRFSAAIAAAQAAAGQDGAPPLGETELARLRQQARDWLHAEIAAWGRAIAEGRAEWKRASIAFRSWQTSVSFNGIRDAEALAKLPLEEQDACRALWREVATLLANSAAKQPEEVGLSAQLATADLARDCGQLQRAAEGYNRAATMARAELKRDPERSDARTLLGEALSGHATALCLLGRTEEALVTIDELIELDGDEHSHWNLAAALWAHLGDHDHYRRHCRRMLDRFGGTTDTAVAERTAKACLLLPGDDEALERASRLAQLAVAKGGDRPGFLPYALFADGLAQYRSGRFTAADRRLHEALAGEVTGWNLTIPAHLVLAMSQTRLDHIDEARASLARALRTYQTDVASPGGLHTGGDRHDRLICDVLRREAEALFLDRTFRADPFAR
jgi:serine/threonine protein kinase/tetratricopeptide (TPR) repeat protein